MLMSGWAFLRNKFVVTIQDYAIIWPTKDYFLESTTTHPICTVLDRLAASVRKRVKLAAAGRLRYAVCVSAFVAREVHKVNARTRLAVIGNCISPLWQQHKLPKKRDIDILYVGKLMPYKGLDVLLQAVFLIVRDYRCRVVIVGEGLHKRYAALATRLGISDHITFTGPLAYAHIPKYYLHSKIVVSPSIWPEPCGRSIIEAMWTGCAVVATSVGGTPESLIDKTHGYLVSPSNPAAIAAACLRLLEDEKTRETFGKAAYSYARRLYTADTIAKAYAHFYVLIKSH